jgi:hypothetical protein
VEQASRLIRRDFHGRRAGVGTGLSGAHIRLQLHKRERNFRAGNGLAEEEALKLHAALGAQDLKLLLGLHAFRGRYHAEA